MAAGFLRGRKGSVREVHIAGLVSGAGPDDVFAAVTDLERFPELCDDVREVRVDLSDGVQQSAWKVKFRGGTLEWTERDEPDPNGHTMSFRQIHGDFKDFDGEWRVEGTATGSAEVVITDKERTGFPARIGLGVSFEEPEFERRGQFQRTEVNRSRASTSARRAS